MESTPNILAEYEQEPIRHSKFYMPATILLCVFFCFLIADTFMDIERLAWTGFHGDWIDISLSVVIPGSGLALFIAKKKAGWFISTVFLSFIAVAATVTIFYEAINNSGSLFLFDLNARKLFIIIITVAITILLHTKNIRLFFRVKNLLWIITIIISLCIALLLISFS